MFPEQIKVTAQPQAAGRLSKNHPGHYQAEGDQGDQPDTPGRGQVLDHRRPSHEQHRPPVFHERPLMPAPLKKHHLIVLRALYDLNNQNRYLWTFSRIGEACKDGVLKSDIRRIVRFLKRRGYVEYSQAFSEDNALVCGSGHIITIAGIQYIQELPS